MACTTIKITGRRDGWVYFVVPGDVPPDRSARISEYLEALGMRPLNTRNDGERVRGPEGTVLWVGSKRVAAKLRTAKAERE